MNRRWPSCSSSVRNFGSIGNASGEMSQSFSAKRPSFGKALRMMSILLSCSSIELANSQLSTINSQLYSSPRGHLLERKLDQFFCRFSFAMSLQIANGFVGVDLFVAERDQREHRFVGLFLFWCRRVRCGRSFPRRRDAEFVFQLEDDSLRGLLAKSADLLNCADIGIDDRGFEIRDAHSA